MKKYIILSVNDNPEYLFYTPLTVWAWRYFGWEPIVFYQGDSDNFDGRISDLALEGSFGSMYVLDKMKGYESETITQVSRLYAACLGYKGELTDGDNMIMTGDIDMIPLSDYWHPKTNRLTVYGHDLTGYGHYPICYIAMNWHRWVDVMRLSEFGADYNYAIKSDLDKLPQAKSLNRVKRWVTDQDLITERINKSGLEVDHYHRGTYKNGYARGRVDRSAWTLQHDQLIDCHMLRGIYKDQKAFNLTMDLLLKVWPNEDWQWFVQYTNEFKKLCQI